MELAQPNKTYHTTHSWVYSCQYHVVFCPKYRKLIIEKQSEYGYTVLEMEVMPDHVHLLLDVNPQIGIASVIAKIKGYTGAYVAPGIPPIAITITFTLDP